VNALTKAYRRYYAEREAADPEWVRSSPWLARLRAESALVMGPGGGVSDPYEAVMVNYPGFWPGYDFSKDVEFDRPTVPAPAPVKAAPTPSAICPCGIDRRDCEYHRCP